MNRPLSMLIGALSALLLHLGCAGGAPGQTSSATAAGAPSDPMQGAAVEQGPIIDRVTPLALVGRGGFGFDLAQHPTEPVFAIASGPDLLLYDVEGPTLRARLSGVGSELRAITFSPDGRQVLAGTVSGKVLAWDLRVGARQELCDLGAPVFRIVFSPVGATVATKSRSGLQLWPDGLGPDKRRIDLDGSSFGLGFTPDGKRLVGRSTDLLAWDATTGNRLWSVRAAQGPSQNGFALSPDGAQLVWADEQAGVQVLDTATGRVTRTLASGGSGAVYFSRTATRVLVSGGKQVRLLDAQTGALVASFSDAKAELLGFSPDGTRFAFKQGQELVIGDANTGQVQHTVTPQPRMGTRAWCASSQCVIVGLGNDGLARVDVADGEIHTTDVNPVGIRKMAWAPDGRHLALVDQDGDLRLVDGLDATLRAHLRGRRHRGSFFSSAMDFSPDGRLLAAGTTHELYLYDRSQYNKLTTLYEEKDFGTVRTPRFSPDGRYLVMIGSRDHKLRLFTLPAGRLAATLDNPADAWGRAAFSARGSLLVTGGKRGVAVLQIPSGQPTFTATTPAQVLRVAWLGGDRVVAAVDRGPILVFRLGQPQPVASLEVPSGASYTMDVSHDGRLLAGAARRGPVRIWSTETWQLLAELPADPRELTDLRWHPCRHWLTLVREGLTLIDPESGESLQWELIPVGGKSLELLAFRSSGHYSGSPAAQRHLRLRLPGTLLGADLVAPDQRPDLYQPRIGAPELAGCPQAGAR